MREWVSVCLSILIALAARKSSNIDCLFQVFARGSEPDQTWTYNSWSRHCANSLATLLEYRDRLRQARDLPCDRRTSRSLGVNPAWVWMCVCVCVQRFFFAVPVSDYQRWGKHRHTQLHRIGLEERICLLHRMETGLLMAADESSCEIQALMPVCCCLPQYAIVVA